MSIESGMPSNHLIFYHPLLLLPSTFPSIRVFSSELALRISWPKYWNFSISPSNEHSVLTSFWIDWFDLFAVQGTLKSLFEHQRSESINSSGLSLLYSPAVTSIHDYWKNLSLAYVDLCWQSSVLVFNTLSRVVIAFLPKSKHLLTSWHSN